MWFQLAQNRDWLRAVLNTITIHTVLKEGRHVLTSKGTVYSSRKTLLGSFQLVLFAITFYRSSFQLCGLCLLDSYNSTSTQLWIFWTLVDLLKRETGPWKGLCLYRTAHTRNKRQWVCVPVKFERTIPRLWGRNTVRALDSAAIEFHLFIFVKDLWSSY
jgi:hypothetical protein